MRKSTMLRRALSGAEPLLAVGAHDGLGARLAEEAGFGAVWASGLEISTSAGVPDANILGMREFLDAAVEMNESTRLPVICDCDTGFGNSNNVIHLVKRYEAAGLAAVAIEDKRFPKVNSFVPGRQELAPVAEFVGKILAAKSAQETEDFVVIARTEALIAGWGLDEALRRAEAYAKAGADAILIHSKKETPDEILTFLERWARRSPVVLVPTTYHSLTLREMAEAGANVVIYANHGLRAAIRAMSETFGEIVRTGSAATVQDRLAPLERVFELQGMIRMKDQEKRFLRGAGHAARVVVPAGGDLAMPESLRAIVGTDTPRVLLDIYGKSILERQVEAFARAEVSDVTLVCDLDPKRLPVDSVRLVAPTGSGLLASVRTGLEAAGPAEGVTLVCYSDLLFDDELVRRLLRSEATFGLLADRSFKADQRARKKSLDLILCEEAPAEPVRMLRAERRHSVRSIGKSIDPGEAHLEFIGMLAMNEEGYGIFLDACQRFEKSHRDRPFGEAPRFAEASLTDLLQELVREGQTIVALEQDKGWMEVHDFDDYRLANEQVMAREKS